MVTVTKYVWDPVFDYVSHELDENNAVKAVYNNEPQQYGGLLSQRRGSTSHYHHHDALGSTRFLTDSSGSVTDTYLYDAWGNLVASTGLTVNPFKWVGQYGYYQDASTGFTYVRGKMYQPLNAVFTQMTSFKLLADWENSEPAMSADTGPSKAGTQGGKYSDSGRFSTGTMTVKMDIFSGGWSGLAGRVEFCPDNGVYPRPCDNIRLIQTVNFKVWDGRNWVSKMWQGNPKMQLNEWRTGNGFHIDVVPTCRHSIFYRDCTPNKTLSKDGYVRPTGIQCASLWDEPGWGVPRDYEKFFMRFETCSVCADEKGGYSFVMGCVHWGYEVKSRQQTTGLKMEFRPEMSPTMVEAIRIYHQKHKK